MSDGQSRMRRLGWKVDRPQPGRSGAMRRVEREAAIGDQELPSSREAGNPWK